MSQATVKISYFVNEYPKVSHTFIRREIQALERHRARIHRVALRGYGGEFPDPDDAAEQGRTQYILAHGPVPVLVEAAWAFLRSPLRFLRALRLTLNASRNSDRSVIYHLFYLAEASVLARWVLQAQSTHIHAHFGTNSANVAMLASVLSGLPYSFTVHGPEEFQREIGLTCKIARARFVVAISSFGRSQLMMHTRPEDWEKIAVVRCGVDPGFLDATRTGIVAAPRHQLVCVGRLCEAKGQILLLQAAARLRDAGVEFELVLAGDGPLRGALETLIDRSGLRERVRITGYIAGSQVREEILRSRALVLPSFAEGLPVVLMEAMALGRPVVTTYVAGIPELVSPGVNGWLVPAGCLESITRAIRECLSAPVEQLQAMGESARAAIARDHDVDQEALRLAALLGSPRTTVRSS